MLYVRGHIPKGTLTDAQADEVVAAMQAGVTAIVTRPSSPGGKRKRGGGGRGKGAELATSPPPLPTCDWVSQSRGRGGGRKGVLGTAVLGEHLGYKG
jgi:hypothetical protein